MQTARAACSSNSSPSRARRAEEHPGDRVPEAPEGERQNGGGALSARGPPPRPPGARSSRENQGEGRGERPPPTARPRERLRDVFRLRCLARRGGRGAWPGLWVSREPLRRALGAPVPLAEPTSSETRRAPFQGAAAAAGAGAQPGSGDCPPRSRRPLAACRPAAG